MNRMREGEKLRIDFLIYKKIVNIAGGIIHAKIIFLTY